MAKKAKKKAKSNMMPEIDGILGSIIKQFADRIFDQLKVIFKIKIKDAREIIVRSLVLSIFFIVGVISALAGILLMIYALIEFLMTLLPFAAPKGSSLFLFGALVVLIAYIYLRYTEKKIQEV